ncbi:MAG: hypothetical protein HFF17_12440 [Oscillospiraceae bacterium]|nr:hypothetical protein [Oscillospiraceae bacterium]
MTASERGILLLCCGMGGGTARPLSAAAFRDLQRRVLQGPGAGEGDVTAAALLDLGCAPAEAAEIVGLLSRERALDGYLEAARQLGLFPLTRLTPGYPAALREKLGAACPPVFFCAGDPALLRGPFVGLAGSRRLTAAGGAFARQAGRLAAAEGFTLVTGGAVGADSAALAACLEHGGRAVVFVPDQLRRRRNLAGPRCLVCSEGGWDLPFSAARACARNRYIHMLGGRTLIAQTGFERGGTWQGAAENLRRGWSQLCVHDDGSPGAKALIARGATAVDRLTSIRALQPDQLGLFCARFEEKGS